MTKINANNERIKLDYVDYLKHDEGLAESTISQKLDAVYLYETATDFADFKTFDRVKAIAFVEYITESPIASATRLTRVNNVKAFFKQLAMDGIINGKKSRRAISAIRLSRKDQRAGQAHNPKKFATVAQFKLIIASMPRETPIERRNRALVAFTLLSGARDGAIISIRLKHVDFERREIMQHPDEVDTKASKLIVTTFFKVGEEVVKEVADYIAYLREELGFTDDDPLFPKTLNGHDENDRFMPIGLTKERWADAGPMRKIFKEAFTQSGFVYRSPHRVRDTMVAHMDDLGLTGKQQKAWSQNIGHKNFATTINCYGTLSQEERHKSMMEIPDEPKSGKSLDDLAEQISALAVIVASQNKAPSA